MYKSESNLDESAEFTRPLYMRTSQQTMQDVMSSGHPDFKILTNREQRMSNYINEITSATKLHDSQNFSSSKEKLGDLVKIPNAMEFDTDSEHFSDEQMDVLDQMDSGFK